MIAQEVSAFFDSMVESKSVIATGYFGKAATISAAIAFHAVSGSSLAEPASMRSFHASQCQGPWPGSNQR